MNKQKYENLILNINQKDVYKICLSNYSTTVEKIYSTMLWLEDINWHTEYKMMEEKASKMGYDEKHFNQFWSYTQCKYIGSIDNVRIIMESLFGYGLMVNNGFEHGSGEEFINELLECIRESEEA